MFAFEMFVIAFCMRGTSHSIAKTRICSHSNKKLVKKKYKTELIIVNQPRKFKPCKIESYEMPQ